MRKHAFTILLAVLVTLPGLFVRAAGLHLPPPLMALLSGLSILGASFVMLWACDAAQTEVSQALALAVVALIAVLPEYSVDMYFTWQAGKYPDGDYAQFAIANMTGANRLLIGVAWALIATLFWFRFKRDVEIEEDRRTELFFLGLATVYAFLIPLKGSLAWYDGVVFICIYLWYLAIAARRPVEGGEPEGPAEILVRLPKSKRRLAIVLSFLFSGCAILANAEPFCEGLIATGKLLHVNEFILIQWLAPVASEAPEFIVALVFAWRGQAGLALGSLLSAKLNQWTLLVGMIPGVFAISHKTLEHPLPMGNGQMSELLLTAAQSLFAVVLLASLRLSIGSAILLFGLFAGQFILPLLSPIFPGLAFGLGAPQIHPVFSIVYLGVAAALFLQRPSRVFALLKDGGRLATFTPPVPPPASRSRNSECDRCPHRSSPGTMGDRADAALRKN